MKCITLKKEDTEEKIIEYHQTKTTHRNKREKKHGDIELPENKKKTKDILGANISRNCKLIILVENKYINVIYDTC